MDRVRWGACCGVHCRAWVIVSTKGERGRSEGDRSEGSVPVGLFVCEEEVREARRTLSLMFAGGDGVGVGSWIVSCRVGARKRGLRGMMGGRELSARVGEALGSVAAEERGRI